MQWFLKLTFDIVQVLRTHFNKFRLLEPRVEFIDATHEEG